MAEFTAALEVYVLILFFYLEIRSLLRIIIGGERALDLFSILDNRLLLRGVIMAGNSGDVVIVLIIVIIFNTVVFAYQSIGRVSLQRHYLLTTRVRHPLNLAFYTRLSLPCC